jgi:ParB family chromosome partitioning protein
MAKLELLKQVQERTGTQDAGAVNIKDIPIGEISVKSNIRESDTVDIEDLKASIRQVGLLQPITVYRDGDGYICIIGHRRLRAYRELYREDKDRFHSIRAIVTDDKNITVRQLIENVQRTDLKPIELYKALKELKGQGLNYKQIAGVIGKSEGYVKNLFSAIKEIESDPENMELLKSDIMSLSDFKTVKPVKDKAEKKKLLKARADGSITQKELQERVKSQKVLGKQEENEQRANKGKSTEDDFLNQFYSLDLDAYQLGKITRAVVIEALSKTHGKDRQAIIADVQKIIKQYRSK